MQRQKQSHHIKLILVIFALFCLDFLKILKNVCVFIITKFFGKPFKGVLRFMFYKIFVKGYCLYLGFIKKLGLSEWRGRFFSFLFYKKLVHVLLGIITIIIIFINFTNRIKAGTISEDASKTILFSLVRSEFNILSELDVLIEENLDEEVVVATPQSYLDQTTITKPAQLVSEETKKQIEEINNIDIAVNSEGAALIKPDLVTTRKTKIPRTEIIDYTVEPGDSVSTIAENFDISVNTILWENNLSAYSLIRPGDKLTILPFTGIRHKVAKGENLSTISKKYKIDLEKIIEVNKLGVDQKLAVGEQLLIPEGRKIIVYKPRTTVAQTSLSAIKNIVSSKSNVASNKMCWPTDGHRISQYYSWRHLGLDIANKTGTPLYAADAGTVEYAGWSNGYGYNIIINHGGGKKTRYAHASKLYVKQGDQVSKCGAIAAMGSTGWSTGPHIHFEVIISGKKYNPLNYIR